MEATVAYREEFVCWVKPEEPSEDWLFEHAHVNGDCDWGWACNVCWTRIDVGPCPDHAPTQFPGLRPAECAANPMHHWFGYDADDYGLGCPTCTYLWEMDNLRELEKATHHMRHWRWRRWRITGFLLGVGSRLRIVRGYGWTNNHACNGCVTGIVWRWS